MYQQDGHNTGLYEKFGENFTRSSGNNNNPIGASAQYVKCIKKTEIKQGVSCNSISITAIATANPKVLKPQLDSNMGKQIMQNMESVMKTLKRRSKHKKHQKKRASKMQDKAEDSEPGDGDHVRTVEVPAESDEEEESLASLKKTWLSARRSKPGKSDPVAVPDPDKKNAFQMLMLNGRVSQGDGNTMSPNDENQSKKVSPDVGKRRLSSGQKEQVKRRKVRVSDGQPPVANGE